MSDNKLDPEVRLVRNTERTIDPMDAILDADFGPLPIGPTGDFRPMGDITPEPLPPATPDNFVCLRGPCRHYLQITQNFPIGNAAGTLERLPVQVVRSCMRISGMEVDLTDATIRDCNQWHPEDESLVQLRNTKREEWKTQNNKEW